MKELAKEVLTILIMALAPALAAAIGGIITACGKALYEWLKAKTQTETTLDKWRDTDAKLNLAYEAVETAIGQTFQTMVDEWKESGEWNDELKRHAKSAAIEIARSLMSEEVIDLIRSISGNEIIWIGSTIENRLAGVKAQRAEQKRLAYDNSSYIVGFKGDSNE